MSEISEVIQKCWVTKMSSGASGAFVLSHGYGLLCERPMLHPLAYIKFKPQEGIFKPTSTAFNLENSRKYTVIPGNAPFLH